MKQAAYSSLNKRNETTERKPKKQVNKLANTPPAPACLQHHSSHRNCSMRQLTQLTVTDVEERKKRKKEFKHV